MVNGESQVTKGNIESCNRGLSGATADSYYNVLVLARTLTFSPDQDESFFQELPAAAAVFLLRGEGEPYVSKTANLRRRLQRLLGPPAEHSKRLNLRDRVRDVEFTATGSDFESQFLLYRVLRETFPSRTAAEKFANDALDFFKMRRCVEDLNPDPAFPGCVYSEMKMCLAPCFKGCTDSEYHAEVARVQAFFDTSGHSLTRELAEQRDHASAELAFEDAAATHAKIEKLKPVLAQLPEIVRRIDRLGAIILQPSAEAGAVSLFRFSDAQLAGPLTFSIKQRAESQSMESRVEAIIHNFPGPEAKSTTERIEHLAILKRWHFRSRRTGEIFFADDKGAWPLRRIVRGIGRVYRGEKPQEDASFSATGPAVPPS